MVDCIRTRNKLKYGFLNLLLHIFPYYPTYLQGSFINRMWERWEKQIQ
jgi:hypothetical protein